MDAELLQWLQGGQLAFLPWGLRSQCASMTHGTVQQSRIPLGLHGLGIRQLAGNCQVLCSVAGQRKQSHDVTLMQAASKHLPSRSTRGESSSEARPAASSVKLVRTLCL